MPKYSSTKTASRIRLAVMTPIDNLKNQIINFVPLLKNFQTIQIQCNLQHDQLPETVFKKEYFVTDSFFSFKMHFFQKKLWKFCFMKKSIYREKNMTNHKIYITSHINPNSNISLLAEDCFYYIFEFRKLIFISTSKKN